MRSIVRLLTTVALTLIPVAGFCQAGPPAASPPAKPSSLADALKALPSQSLPQDTLIFTVGAENARPSRMSLQAPIPNTNIDANGNVLPPPPDPTTINGILTIYDRTWQTFGKVAAVAPTQMTVLNVDPNALSQIDPVGLSPGDAMKILLGSLSSTQWQELSSSGLGIDELNGAQSALFRAAVHLPVKIVPSTARWNPPIGQPGFDWQQYQQDYNSKVQTLTSDMLAGARLEAHLATMYLLPVPSDNGNNQMWMDESGSPGIAGVYQISSIDGGSSNDNPLSSLIRMDMPNTLKPGSLNWNIRPLGATVPLDGVKTVDDLVNRIARATGLELYCDPHYAGRSVLILDTTGRPQRARDLLEALCVCVCGAWRQVGPAYVLTDDLQGVSTRRSLLKEMTNVWTNNLRKLTGDANDSMVDKGWFKSLQFLPGDPDALSADQMNALENRVAGPQSGNDWLNLPFSQVPASAQSVLKDEMGRFANNGDNQFSKVAAALGPDYKMNANLQVRVFLDVPSIGLVALDQGSYYTDVSMRKQGGGRIDPPPPAAGKTNGPVTFAGAAGALCAPRDAAEARAVVDKMAAMGLHVLYCDAFANGKAYIANSAVPTDSAQAAVLPAAIEEGKAKGVRVVAVIDAFAWGSGDPKTRLNSLPPGFAEDETVTLEAASDALRERAASQEGLPYARSGTVVQWVSPADTRVQGTLGQIVGAVARIPGLAGLAFEDTAPPSYLSQPNFYDVSSVPLGYGPQARLAFLRAHHADPIDFGDEDNNMSVFVGSGIGSSWVNLDIPTFDENGYGSNLQPAWDASRKQADVSALEGLYGAARSINPALPLYLQSSGYDGSFLPWIKPDQAGNEANMNGFDPSRMPPGTQFVLPWSEARNAGALSYIFPYLNNLFSKAKTPPVLLFDLAKNPSPDGPVRNLEVISEHVKFAPPATASPHP